MSQFHVLIADDDPLLSLIMEHKLTAAGYLVDCVQNGQAALAAVDRLRPDIVLLDAMMPVMDGFEALRRLKAGPHRDSVAVIMVTALERDEDIATAVELGVADYLIKPLNLDELVARLERLTLKQRIAG